MNLLRALRESETWFSLGQRIWTWAGYLIGAVLSGGGSFAAGKATPWINQYGPIALAGCALFGLILASLAYYLWASARLRHARATYAFEASQHDEVSVNPLDTRFVGRRIKLAEFVPPLPEPVTGKTFTDCDLLGPIVLAIFNNTTIATCSFQNCDFVLAQTGSTAHTALQLEATFTNCRFIRVTFLVHPAAAPLLPRGANWVTAR